MVNENIGLLVEAVNCSGEEVMTMDSRSGLRLYLLIHLTLVLSSPSHGPINPNLRKCSGLVPNSSSQKRGDIQGREYNFCNLVTTHLIWSPLSQPR